MRKIPIILGMAIFTAVLYSCKGAGGDYPGDAYAPDMYYSRAYETYAYNSKDSYDSLKASGAHYNAMPVPGTVARGEVYNYHLTADSAGIKASNALVNPFDSLAAGSSVLAEGERLYNINCGICHGTKLDGNGPLFNNGNGPYAAKPRELNGDYVKALTDGYIYHVITFGKGVMGSYASQLHPDQRWWVINYIRSKQPGGAAPASSTTDSTATAKTN
jgi:mono/diheme cytochrome c family protein